MFQLTVTFFGNPPPILTMPINGREQRRHLGRHFHQILVEKFELREGGREKKLSLKLTDFAPENRPGPKRKDHLPTIHFQVRTVSFREGSYARNWSRDTIWRWNKSWWHTKNIWSIYDIPAACMIATDITRSSKKIHILLGWHALSDVEQVLGMLQPVPPLSVVLNFAQALAVLDCSNVRCKTGLCCAVLIPSKQTRHNGSVFLQLKSVHDMTPCIEYCTYITTVYCIHMYSKCSDIQYSVSWQTRRKCCSEYAAISTRWKNLSSFFFSMLKARV